MCEWRSVRVRCHDSPHDEAPYPHLRPFHTVSLGTSVNKGMRKAEASLRSSGSVNDYFTRSCLYFTPQSRPLLLASRHLDLVASAHHAVLVDRPPAHIGSVIRHVQHLVAKVPVALIVGATEPPLDDLPLPLPGRTVRRGEVDRVRRE